MSRARDTSRIVLTAAPMGNEINILNHGGVGDYATDNYAAAIAARDAAAALGTGVYFPAGSFAFTQQVDWQGVPYRGAGDGLTVIYTPNLNIPIFTSTIDATIEGQYYGDLWFVNGIANGGDYSGSAAMEFKGNNSGFFQRNRFSHITGSGFKDVIVFNRASHTTGFGEEGTCAFNQFDHINAKNNNNPGRSVIRYRQGSGTGHVYNQLGGNHGAGNADASFLRFDGAYVVGDMTIANTQFSSAPNAVLIDAAATYLSNITFPGSQFDAGCVYPIKIGAGATILKSLRFEGTNFGGSTDLAGGLGAGVYVNQTILRELQGDEWTVGNEQAVTVGAQSRALFTVDIAQYYGSQIELIVGGPALDGAVHIEKFLINRNGAGSLSASHITAAGSTGGASPVTITTGFVGTVLTFTAAFTATAHGNLESLMVKRFGAVKVQRSA